MIEFDIFGCSHSCSGRQRSGPTSRKKDWMILVDCCLGCGHLTAIHEVTYEQYRWLMRFNLGIKRYDLQKAEEPPKHHMILSGTVISNIRHDDTSGYGYSHW